MTALLPPSDRSLDVLCVGNAIVDVLAQTDDSFLEDHGMVKGSMQLTDPDRARTIYAAMPPAVEISEWLCCEYRSWSATSLGTSVAFIGKLPTTTWVKFSLTTFAPLGLRFMVFQQPVLKQQRELLVASSASLPMHNEQ